MSPTITGLNSVSFPVTIIDERELGYDPDLSFSFETEIVPECPWPSDLGPQPEDYDSTGFCRIKFTAADQTELHSKLTEYLVTCYDSKDLAIDPLLTSRELGQLHFATTVPDGLLILF